MKIDKIIMSCDDNEKYLKLWPYVSKVCKLTLGITPVLFHITDEYSDFKHDEYGVVKKIKKSPDFTSSFQSQLYRIYGTRFFYDETCLISDIDMFIFDKEYFIKQVEEYDDDCFINYISDAYDLERPDCWDLWGLHRIAMCYLLGTGKTFEKLLNLNCDFNEFAGRVRFHDYGYFPPEAHMDEIYVGKMMFRNHNNVNIVNLKRGITDVYNIPRRVNKHQFYSIDSMASYHKTAVEYHIPGDWQENMEEFNKKVNEILTYC